MKYFTGCRLQQHEEATRASLSALQLIVVYWVLVGPREVEGVRARVLLSSVSSGGLQTTREREKNKEGN